mmetsp:Transcript_6559/g.12107  ORF Transcript_6559/g.12107 Transcript_6559/m.12107 type:complete len:242 (+) Transcript_6559:82-807(+)
MPRTGLVAAVAGGATALLFGIVLVKSLRERRSLRSIALEATCGPRNADRLARVLARIDRINRTDPNRDEGRPKELLYSERMSAMLSDFAGELVDEELQIAARAQHIARWTSPRKAYPEGRAGYLKWRSDLYTFHGSTAKALMLEEGYDEAAAERVKYLLSKQGLKGEIRHANSQLLEDVVCLVFLKYYWKPFSNRDDFDEEKLIKIVQRTWAKMSNEGHDAALKLQYGDHELALIQKALGA